MLVLKPSAVSAGYGRQSLFGPCGTESPSATIDHIRGAVVVPAPLVEDAVDPLDDLPHPAKAHTSTASPTTPQPTRPLVTFAV